MTKTTERTEFTEDELENKQYKLSRICREIAKRLSR